MPRLPLGVQTLKCVVTGTMYGIQTWSCGVYLDLGNGAMPTQAQLDALALQVANQFNAWSVQLETYWGNTTQSNGVNVYLYGPGSVTADMQSTSLFSSPVVGTSTAPGPSFICQVASLRTSLPQKSGRGRMYVPLTSQGALAGDETTAACVALFSSATRNLLHALNGLTVTFAGAISVPVVASFTKGYVTPITSVKVGSRYELQRRRNDQFADTYTTVTPM